MWLTLCDCCGNFVMLSPNSEGFIFYAFYFPTFFCCILSVHYMLFLISLCWLVGKLVSKLVSQFVRLTVNWLIDCNYDLGENKRDRLRKSLDKGSKMFFNVSNLLQSFCVVLVMLYPSLHAVWHWLVWKYMYFGRVPLLSNSWLLESTAIYVFIITSKQIRLQSRAKSQIVRNSFAVPDLM